MAILWQRLTTKYVLLFLFISSSAIAGDKIEHAAVSYSVSYTCSVITDASLLCAMGVFTAGLVKEFAVDAKPDAKDILANGVGIGLSLIMFQF